MKVHHCLSIGGSIFGNLRKQLNHNLSIMRIVKRQGLEIYNPDGRRKGAGIKIMLH
jgi:hypothetical protein